MVTDSDRERVTAIDSVTAIERATAIASTGDRE
jgi:hypothetical protein